MSKTPNHGKKKNGTHRADAKHLPGFSPTMTIGAGPAASGVRVGFPAERTVTMNYCDIGTFTSTSGVQGKHQFRINSAFDPDLTGTGHQPMGFDQWSLFYNHYVVEECRFDVELGPTASSATAGGSNSWVGCHLSDDLTIPLATSELMELGSQSAYTSPYSTANSHVFKGTVDVGRFYNRSSIATDTELRAAVGQNPIEQVILTLWGHHPDQSSSLTFYFGIKLSMRIRFMEPKDLTPSLKSAGGPDDFEYVRVPKKSGVILPGV